jgi:hypothetical protein
MVIGSLVTNIVADLSKWGANLNKARGQFASFTKNIGTLQTVMAAATAGAVASFIKSTVDEASALQDAAVKLNINVESLQKYRFAAAQMGSSASTMDRSLGFLNKTLGKVVKVGGASADVFANLGLNVVKLANQGLDKTFLEVMDAIRELPTGAQQASAMVSLFGRSGQDMFEIMRSGTPEIKRLGDELQKIGGVASSGAVAGLEAVGDEVNKLATAWKALSIEAVATGGPALTVAMKTAQKELSWWRSLINLPQRLLQDAMGSRQYEMAFGSSAAKPVPAPSRGLPAIQPRNPAFSHFMPTRHPRTPAMEGPPRRVLPPAPDIVVNQQLKDAQRGLVQVMNMLPGKIQLAIANAQGKRLPGFIENAARGVGGLAAGFGGLVPAMAGGIGGAFRKGERVGPLEMFQGGTRDAYTASRENLRPRQNAPDERVAKAVEKSVTLEQKMEKSLGTIAKAVTGGIEIVTGAFGG